MSCTYPTGARSRVSLRTPGRHLGFLTETFRLVRGAAIDALAPPDRPRDRPPGRRDADALERLIAGVRACEIEIPDANALRVLEAVLEAADAGTEYGRVVAEHAALVGVLGQLGRWS
jgi:hypothetical protein